MPKSINLTLPEEVREAHQGISDREGISTDAAKGEAVREYVFFRRFRLLRDRMVAEAKMQGVISDEDVFDRLS